MHDSDCHGNFGLLKVVRRHIQLSFAVKRDWNAQIEKTCKTAMVDPLRGKCSVFVIHSNSTGTSSHTLGRVKMYRSLAKKGPLTKERPPPTFRPISCTGSKFTRMSAHPGGILLCTDLLMRKKLQTCLLVKSFFRG